MNDTNARVPVGFDSFGPWFTEAFELLKAQWQTWVLISLVYAGIAAGAVLIIVALVMALVMVIGPFGVFLAYLVGILVMLSASALIMPGIMKTALKQIRGEAISVGDMFSGTNVFTDAVVVLLATVAGVIACGIGQLVTGTLFFLAMPIVADKRLGYSDALKKSMEVTKQNFIFFLVYILVLGVVSELGFVACGIGILFTMPMSFLGMAIAYERTFNAPAVAAGLEVVPQAPPPAPPAPPTAPETPQAPPAAPEAPEPPTDTPPPPPAV